MPGPRDNVIYWPGPPAFSVVQKPWDWAHILVQKPRGARGDDNLSNWYLHNTWVTNESCNQNWLTYFSQRFILENTSKAVCVMQ